MASYLDISNNILGVATATTDRRLEDAARKGKLEEVKRLVEEGADINARENLLLQFAAGEGRLEAVKFLVEQGADIHADNDCALQRAACQGHLSIVKYLVEQGADIHADNDYALQRAAFLGWLEIVKYLVEQGVNVHVINIEQLLASNVDDMCPGDFNGTVKYLAEQGVDIHANNDYALRLAIGGSHHEVVEYLKAACNNTTGSNIFPKPSVGGRKYEFTGETKLFKLQKEVTLNQIRAVRDFGEIKVGKLGGWIESEVNLSHDGLSWVGGRAYVFGNATVDGNGMVLDEAIVFDDAVIEGNGRVLGMAQVYEGAVVRDKGEVAGNVRIHGDAIIEGNDRFADHEDISNNYQIAMKTTGIWNHT